MPNNTIGTDPEFFIRHKESGKYMNAETIFPGTKDEPFIMKSGAGLQTDNVAVEYASPVAQNGEDFVNKLRNTFNELFKMIPEDVVLDLSPSANFEDDQLLSNQANLFGCSASYDAWELCENDQPNAENTNMRSIGGHIHIGAEADSENAFLLTPYGKIDVVKMCDTFHGIISVTLDTSKEAVKRKELYGKAGEHRPTDYGVEYRSLSSFWLKSPDLVMLINSLTIDVLQLISKDKHNGIIDSIGADKIQNIVNNGDIASAQVVIDEVLMNYLSEDSKHYLKLCTEKINSYDLVKEWAVVV